METIDEAVKRIFPDCNNELDQRTIEMFRDIFRNGVEFAQQWIPVEEELPIFEGEEFQILVKGHKDDPDKVVCWTVGIAENESVIRLIFTHWRPVELK